MSVFILQHESGEGDALLIGAYSSRERAEKAIARLLGAPGFREHPDGFTIDEYVVDKDHWTEGFFTHRPGEEAGDDVAPGPPGATPG